jgi:hypothetical protein
VTGQTLNDKEKMKSNIINEIVQTEMSYVNSLKTLLTSYKLPLEQSQLLTSGELDLVFVNLVEIIELNSKFAKSLKKRHDEANQRDELARVGDLFVDFLPRMQIYTRYVSAKRIDADSLINDKMRSSLEFAHVLARATGNSDTGDFLLKKMLLLPMQRLTQYSLLIDKLIKYLPDNDPDLASLRVASKLNIDLNRSINHEVGKKDDAERLDWLEEHISVQKSAGFKLNGLTNLMGPRKLFYYGPFTKESNSNKELYGFLFNDCFLIIESYETFHNDIFRQKPHLQVNGNGNGNRLTMYKQPILLETITNVQGKQMLNSSSVEKTGADCVFQVMVGAGDKEYSLRTVNPALKNEWVKQLQKSIEAYKQNKRSITQSISSYTLSPKSAIGRFLLLIMEAQDLATDPLIITNTTTTTTTLSPSSSFSSNNNNSNNISSNSLSNQEKNIFCEATMSAQKFSTHSLDSHHPKWNTSMQFQIYDLNKDSLSVLVYDKRVFAPNTLLGKTELKMAHIYNQQQKENQENNPIVRQFKINSGAQSARLKLKMSISIYK